MHTTKILAILTPFIMLFALEMDDGPSRRDHFMRSGFASGRSLGNRGKGLCLTLTLSAVHSGLNEAGVAVSAKPGLF